MSGLMDGLLVWRMELDHVRRVFDERVGFGDKEGAEELYQGVYELREYMNRVHAGTVWRREVS